MQKAIRHGADGETTLGKDIIAKLRAKKLAQMVDWFDPLLLAKIGVREMVSGTMGQYADQRLMQSATDRASEDDLKKLYDYRSELQASPQQGLWVDYISDMGDGFEATFAMASLMAQDSLEVAPVGGSEGSLHLDAGKILIMGGDQAYPQSSVKEYKDRLLDPYNWAFTTKEPVRKLFALPGNHDWYDGLASFDSLFCSARDRISKGDGKQIGGWRCQQHRSYFAICLPDNWWIWGADIQLGGSFDDPQRDYFDLKAEQTKPGDKIIICLAEPSWLHENYENLDEISILAQKRGARVCAVLAGDWHHYSRFRSDKLGVQFITCGGGGAFAHATHGLPSKINLSWALPKISGQPFVDLEDAASKSRMRAEVVHRSEKIEFAFAPYEISTRDVPDETPAAPKHASGLVAPQAATTRTGSSGSAESIYPSRMKSRLLSLKNLWLPFHNKRFALFVGLVYYLFAWVFHTSIASYDVNKRLGETSQSEATQAADLAKAADSEAQYWKRRADDLASNPAATVDLEAAKRQADVARQAADSADKLAKAIGDRARAVEPALAESLRVPPPEDPDTKAPAGRAEPSAPAGRAGQQSRAGQSGECQPSRSQSCPKAAATPAATAAPKRVDADELMAAAKTHAFIASGGKLSVRGSLDVLRTLSPQVAEDLVKGTALQGSLSEDYSKAAYAYAEALSVRDLTASAREAAAVKRLSLAAAAASQTVAARAKEVAENTSTAAEVAEAAKQVASEYEFIAGLETEFAAKVRPLDQLDRSFQEFATDLWYEITDPGRVFIASQANPAFFFMLLGLWAGLIYYADIATRTWMGLATKLWLGTLHFMAHMAALLAVNSVGALALTGVGFVAVAILVLALLLIAVLLLSPILIFVVLPLALIGWLVFSTDMGSGLWSKAEALYSSIATVLDPVITVLWLPFSIFGIEGVPGALAFVVASTLLGGMLGAMIFGIYWALMSAFFAKHTGDAFGALGLRHYKHFLRMHFEPDRLTIYPISLDTVPGRRGWRAFNDGEARPSHNPQITAKTPLQPRLIEAPIVIDARKVLSPVTLVSETARTAAPASAPGVQPQAAPPLAVTKLVETGNAPGSVVEMRKRIDADRRSLASPDVKAWCRRRWRYLFLREAASDAVALDFASRRFWDRRPPVQRIAEYYLHGEDRAAWRDEQAPATIREIKNTTLVACPGLLNGLLPVRDFQDQLPGLETRFGMRVLRADAHPARGCDANVADLLRAINEGKGRDASGAEIPAGNARPPGDVMLLGYSKGAADILTLLVQHPELKSRVRCVVTVAGAIGGSELADKAADEQKSSRYGLDALSIASAAQGLLPSTLSLGGLAISRAEEYDVERAVGDLTTKVRQQFLALFKEQIDALAIPMFYMRGATQASEVPATQRSGFRMLAKIDPMNDMHVTSRNAALPFPLATDLGLFRAHHWDIAYGSFRKGRAFNNLYHPFPKEAALVASVTLAAELGLID